MLPGQPGVPGSHPDLATNLSLRRAPWLGLQLLSPILPAILWVVIRHLFKYCM